MKHLLPVVLVLAVLGAGLALHAGHWFTWQAVARHQVRLQTLASAHPLAAPALFILSYVVLVGLSVPEGALLTIIGGLLFGTRLATVCAVIGSTLGAVTLLLILRVSLAPTLQARAGPLLARIRPGLERDGFSYLLTIRLIPVVPFWLVNLAAGLIGMRLVPYAAATFLGIIPSTFVFAAVGSGLGEVLAAGGRPDFGVMFQPHVLAPILGLALLALLPVAVGWWRRRRG